MFNTLPVLNSGIFFINNECLNHLLGLNHLKFSMDIDFLQSQLPDTVFTLSVLLMFYTCHFLFP
jgi:hypothetical protein